MVSTYTEMAAQDGLVEVGLNEVALAVKALREHGMVILKGAVPIEPLRTLNERMNRDTEELLKYCDTIGGNPREHGHLQQGPPLSADYVFAEVAMNQHVNQICVELFQNNPRLVFYNGNTNCPGSVTQRLHADGVHETKEPDPIHEPRSVVVDIPTLPMSPENGAIELWPATHMLRERPDDSVRSRGFLPIQPTMAAGDVLIRDVRLWHRGVPNNSSNPRHMIALIVSSELSRNAGKLKFELGCEKALEGHSVSANSEYVQGPLEYLIGPTRRIYERKKEASQSS